jgi:hypothetical protein
MYVSKYGGKKRLDESKIKRDIKTEATKDRRKEGLGTPLTGQSGSD